jgi:integrase
MHRNAEYIKEIWAEQEKENAALRARAPSGPPLRTADRYAGGLHDLRHFYASGLIRAGCDVVTVQRALGHSSAVITLTTYSHLWPAANDRTRGAAGELLEASLGAAADPLRTESEI